MKKPAMVFFPLKKKKDAAKKTKTQKRFAKTRLANQPKSKIAKCASISNVIRCVKISLPVDCQKNIKQEEQEKYYESCCAEKSLGKNSYSPSIQKNHGKKHNNSGIGCLPEAF